MNETKSRRDCPEKRAGCNGASKRKEKSKGIVTGKARSQKNGETALFARNLMIAVIGCLLPAGSMYAATVPDAGSIYRDEQIQRQQQSGQPVEAEKRQQKAKKTPSSDNGRITVRGFTIKGHEGLATQDELNAVVAGAIGSTLNFKELQGQCDKITAYLKEKGWLLARAYLSPKDVTDGNITIVIIQGTSDGLVNMMLDKSVRIRKEVLIDIAGNATSKGEAINNDKLERAVMLMNDLPGIRAKTTLMPGSLYGTSGIDVSVREGPLANGTLWVDNYANYYSGTWRANALVSINDPLNYGDQVTLQLAYASGLTQMRLGYNFPLDSSGLRGRLSGTTMNYELGKELADMRYKGTIHAIEAGVSYPVIRSRTSSLQTGLTYGFRSLSDSQSSQEIQNKTLNSITVSASGDRYDPMIGSYTLNWNINCTTGKLNTTVANTSPGRTDDGYIKINAAAQNTIMHRCF